MSFKDLKVDEKIVKALEEDHIIKPTTIQEKAIPLVKAGRDLIGMSRTGSGKTAAFCIPLLEQIEKGKGIQALVLTPTRELAVQIAKELKKFGKYLNFNVSTVYGGVSMGPQIDSFETAEIVVATPGRTLDHLNRRNLDITKLKIFVLDEADKMVEMGFIEDIEDILSYSNKERQILLFGATISGEIENIKRNHMKNPAVAQAETHVKKDLLKQYYYECDKNEKFSLLVHLLGKEDTDRVIIFCSSRNTVEIVTRNLRDNHIKAEMLHGKMNQAKRLRVIDNFNKEKFEILVASAVAARGLHIEGVSHVINYDLSQDPQEYVHRVGRTARAGQSGKAITLLGPRDHDAFNGVFRRYPDLDIELLDKGKFPRVSFKVRSLKGRHHNFRNPRGGSHFGSNKDYRGNRRYNADSRGSDRRVDSRNQRRSNSRREQRLSTSRFNKP